MTQVSKTDTALAFAELPFWRPFKDNLGVIGQDRREGGHPTPVMSEGLGEAEGERQPVVG